MKFDLTVIGGGILGLSVSWLAAEKGLKVLLIESGSSLASATSANSHKIMHGGFRYLSSLDLARARESSVELNWMLSFFPRNVVKPLRCALALNPAGLQSRYPAMAACVLFKLLSVGLSNIPSPKVISKLVKDANYDENSSIDLGSERNGFLTWSDAFLANHSELVNVLHDEFISYGGVTYLNSKISNIEKLSLNEFQIKLGDSADAIKTKSVVTAAGVGVSSILLNGESPKLPDLTWVKAFNLRLNREIGEGMAFGAASRFGNTLFLVPRIIDGVLKSALGTCYLPINKESIINNNINNVLPVSENQIQAFLDEASGVFDWHQRYTSGISKDEVLFVESGIIPVKTISKIADTKTIAYRTTFFGRSFCVNRCDNFIDLIGTKYSSFRATARKVLDKIII